MGFFNFPISRILFYFIAGIIIGNGFADGFAIGILCMALTLFLFVVPKRYFEIVLAICWIATGVLITSQHLVRPQSHYLNVATDAEQVIDLTIREKLRPGKTNSRYFAMVSRIDGKRATGKILLNIRGENDLPIGLRMLVKTKIDSRFPIPNPGSFDYGKYLQNKSVFAQAYVSPDECLKTGMRFDIWHFADRLRSRILRNLKIAGMPERELALAAALILGQQQDIERDVLKDYQNAGAVHILSVSGLHVGLVIVFLNFALARLPKHGRWRLAKLIVTLICLWGFAFIAGMSPSVIRSAVMFSFVAYGMYLRRSTNVFHTLTASALLILLVDPSLLFDIGFQLSYAALYFILCLQPVSKRINYRSRLTRFFGDIIFVSIAAQIGTAPLTLYYFHQFPGLFLLTNVVIIPFISVIMGVGVLLMIWAAIMVPPDFLHELLTLLLRALNHIISGIASFESLVFKDIPFTFAMAIASMLFALSIAAFARKPTARNVIIVGITMLLFQSVLIFEESQNEKVSELIVFNSRQTQIAKRISNRVTNYSDTIDRRNIESYLVNAFASEQKAKIQNLIYFRGTKILIIDSSFKTIPKLKPDYVLLRQSTKINLDRFFQDGSVKAIIADGSNYKSYARRWEQSCRKQKIPFHYTNEKGFFRISD